MSKKVLIIVQNLPLPFDRRVWLEAKTLTNAGYQVSIICPTGKHGKYQDRYEYLDNIHIYRYPAPPEAYGVFGYIFEFLYCWLLTALLSIRVLKERGFDLIQACNPPETYFFLAWFYQLLGKRFIFDHHDLSPEMYLAKDGDKDGILYKGLLFLEYLTFKTASVVMTTNESHKEIAMQRGGVSADNIFIVRSGPDFDRLQVLEPDPSLKEGFPYLACYLGEMCPQDGVDHLLYAAKILIEDFQRKDIKFVLMGGGPSLEDLKQLSQELKLDDQVTFTGRVSDEDLCRYLSTADICLDPDPYTEWADKSTMNKIMEYMTFGKAIVAFNLKEHQFSAQEAAMYAQANDVQEMATLVDGLLNDPEKRQEMGEYGQQRVHSELAWDYSVPPLLAAYDKAFALPKSYQGAAILLLMVFSGFGVIKRIRRLFGDR